MPATISDELSGYHGWRKNRADAVRLATSTADAVTGPVYVRSGSNRRGYIVVSGKANTAYRVHAWETRPPVAIVRPIG